MRKKAPAQLILKISLVNNNYNKTNYTFYNLDINTKIISSWIPNIMCIIKISQCVFKDKDPMQKGKLI